MKQVTWCALLVVVGLGAIAGRAQKAQAQVPCEALSSLSLPNTTITLVQTVSAGENFTFHGRDQTDGDLPAFCWVAATLKPTMDSDIRMEVWLPTSTWNSRFLAVGSNADLGMVRALEAGYATSWTDTGQTGANGTFANGNPERVADYAYRAVHEMTINAKAIMTAFYGRPPLFSYFCGCSFGGGQGVMEAHRYPDDYDGIIAGAPGSPLSHGYAASRLWLAGATQNDPARAIPASVFFTIHEEVVRACDAVDGLTDGLIDDPRRCDFDPNVLVCQGPRTRPCLTIAQVETVKRLLSPVVNPRTGTLIYPPLELGSERQWARFTQSQETDDGDVFRHVFLKNSQWDWRTLDFDRDIARADEVIETARTNTLEPDLREFADRGGKLILVHGWSDVTNAPQSTVNYYNAIQRLLGEATTSNTVRLFMGPGMAHCGGGDGPSAFDGFAALEQWVERGTAPDRIIASHIRIIDSYIPHDTDGTDGYVDRTRPLCPYPQVARYSGSGSTDDAANFECRTP